MLSFIVTGSALVGAAAQTTHAGAASSVLVVEVRDEAKQPVADATVKIGGVAGVFRTDKDGIAQLTVGVGREYGIRVESAEYYPAKVDGVEVSANEPSLVVVELKRAAVVSEILVVTATGTATELQSSPVRTEVIQAALADRQVKTTLAEAFQATVSGVRVETNCQNCGFMQIRMNGLEGPYTQILEDGLPTYSGVTAVYGLEQIPAAFLEQIEVVKGGNSALYGPGAVAGVINLIRREPRENRFRLDALGGWQKGRPEQQIGGAAQIIDIPGGLSGDFFVRSVNRVPVDRDGDGFSEMGKRRLDSGGFSLYRRFMENRGRLSVTGALASEFRRGGDQFELPPEQSWITEQVDSRRYSLAANWNHTISANTFYALRASHAYYARKSYYGSGMDPNAYGDTRNPVWVTDTQAGHQKGSHSLLAGYQVWWEHVEDNAPAYNRTLGGTFNNHGVYFQDEWRPTSRLTLIGGTRVDKSNRLDKAILSPRAGVRVGLSNSLVARATVSTGFRAPAVFDEDLHIAQVGGEGFVLQNAGSLREERSVSYSGGLDFSGLVMSRRVQLGLNLFRTNLHDAFTLAEDVVEGQEFRRLLRINGPDASVGGASFDGTLRLTNQVGIRGGFTAQHARWAEPEPQFGSRSFFRTPSRYGFLGTDWSMPGGVEWSLTADFTGRMIAPHYAGYIAEDRLETTPRFLTFNTVVSRTFELSERKRLRLFLNVQNIGDSYQSDLDRGPSRDSAYVYGPSEMRRAVVGLTFEF
ncbi:MAG: TonB-dependent receptor [Bryobacteraceae bacterium]|nr:TonB-dependent receptor [Bryobacteraceae bacterium]